MLRIGFDRAGLEIAVQTRMTALTSIAIAHWKTHAAYQRNERSPKPIDSGQHRGGMPLGDMVIKVSTAALQAAGLGALPSVSMDSISRGEVETDRRMPWEHEEAGASPVTAIQWCYKSEVKKSCPGAHNPGCLERYQDLLLPKS